MHKKYKLILIILPISLLAGILVNEVLNVTRYLHDVTDTVDVESVQFTRSAQQSEWSYMISISVTNPTYRRILIEVDDPVLEGGDLFSEPIVLSSGRTHFLDPGNSMTIRGSVFVNESLFRELRLVKTSEFVITCSISVSTGSIFKARRHLHLLHSQYNLYH